MAIDWGKVTGYTDGMTAEEKLNLLENLPTDILADPKTTKEYMSIKAQFDKASSELADAKKHLRTKMTEDEQAKADREAADKQKDEELATLRREKALSTHKASYLAMGYDEQNAEAAAAAMVDGDNSALFAAMKKHSENAEKAWREKALKDTPTPPAGTPGTEETDAVKLAKKVANSSAKADKFASDVISKYI